MICPRCSVAEISAETQNCVLCGYTPGGVALETEARGTLDEAARRELADLFHIESVTGRGARTLLYVARAVEDERRVLLRVLPRRPVREARLEDRFQREMTAARTLDHAHILPLLAHGATASVLWCSMKYVEGRSLAALLEGREEPLDLATCLRIVEQVANGLEYAHRHGAIHGDVRPANVLLEKDEWVRLSGFGTSRILADATALDAEPADPAYAAPEDASLRQLAPASDQYALAATVYECLTRTRCVPGRSPGLADRRPDVPGHVAEVLRRAMRPIPAERFNTVADFVSALGGAAPAAASPSTPQEPRANPVLLVDKAAPVGRRRVIILVTAVVGGLLLLRLVGGGSGSKRTPEVVIPTVPPAPAEASVSLPETTARPDGRAPRTGTARGTVDNGGTAAAPSARSRPATRSRSTAPLVVEAEPGLLFVSSTPWGEVYVDDRLVGTTPLSNLPIAPGEHRVRIVREGFLPFEQTLSVSPDERVRLTNIVLQAANP